MKISVRLKGQVFSRCKNDDRSCYIPGKVANVTGNEGDSGKPRNFGERRIIGIRKSFYCRGTVNSTRRMLNMVEDRVGVGWVNPARELRAGEDLVVLGKNAIIET